MRTIRKLGTKDSVENACGDIKENVIRSVIALTALTRRKKKKRKKRRKKQIVCDKKLAISIKRKIGKKEEERERRKSGEREMRSIGSDRVETFSRSIVSSKIRQRESRFDSRLSRLSPRIRISIDRGRRLLAYLLSP